MAANGAGASSVAAFNWALTLPPSVVPNIPASIDPSKDLTVTWTGGSAFPVVSIYLYNGVKATSTLKSYVDIICTADGSAEELYRTCRVPRPASRRWLWNTHHRWSEH